MRIGIDIDDTLTDIKEELELAVLEYANKLGKQIKQDIMDLVDKNDGSIYQVKYGFNDVCNCKDITNFIDLCNNSTLVLALKSLSKIEMTVIFLLFEEQLTSSEASKILKICSDSVTRIKRRALKKIEKYMKGDK